MHHARLSGDDVGDVVVEEGAEGLRVDTHLHALRDGVAGHVDDALDEGRVPGGAEQTRDDRTVLDEVLEQADGARSGLEVLDAFVDLRQGRL